MVLLDQCKKIWDQLLLSDEGLVLNQLSKRSHVNYNRTKDIVAVFELCGAVDVKTHGRFKIVTPVPRRLV